MSDNSINFIDVTIQKIGLTLNTKVYFKPTDRNSYLSVKSGHHPAGIKNIPKDRIRRVKRYCSRDDDYYVQSNVLKDKFIQKSYNPKYYW